MRNCLRFTIVVFCCAVLIRSRLVAGQQAPPDTRGTLKVGYVMLGVASIQRTVDFYHGKLGLKVTQQAEDATFFDAGTISIVVSAEVGREPGESEIVFAVDHVQTAYEALAHLGIQFDQAPHSLNEQTWVANFHDPDRHRLSIFGPR